MFYGDTCKPMILCYGSRLFYFKRPYTLVTTLSIKYHARISDCKYTRIPFAIRLDISSACALRCVLLSLAWHNIPQTQTLVKHFFQFFKKLFLSIFLCPSRIFQQRIPQYALRRILNDITDTLHATNIIAFRQAQLCRIKKIRCAREAINVTVFTQQLIYPYARDLLTLT